MVDLSIKEIVHDLLVRFPHLRDSDEKLCANIWFGYAAKFNVETSKGFLGLYAEGKMPNSESITRCRRKIQEEHEALRGNLYKERQNKQDDVKEQLGYTVPDPVAVQTLAGNQLKIGW